MNLEHAPPPSDEATLKLFTPGSYDLVPHDGMRKIIAKRLTESKQHVPHFYVTLDISLDNLLGLRERLNLQAPKDKDGKPAWKISVNDFVIKAMAMALVKVPEANVAWTDAAMVKHKHADIGVAVSIPGGLITPVVSKAETKGAGTNFARDERLCGARQDPQAEAGGVYWRLMQCLQHGHDGG